MRRERVSTDLGADYATGKTNVNRPKDYQIEVQDIRRVEEQVRYHFHVLFILLDRCVSNRPTIYLANSYQQRLPTRLHAFRHLHRAVPCFQQHARRQSLRRRHLLQRMQA